MTPRNPTRDDDHTPEADDNADDNAAVYSFLDRAGSELTRHLDNILPIEAAITKTLTDHSSPHDSNDPAKQTDTPTSAPNHKSLRNVHDSTPAPRRPNLRSFLRRATAALLDLLILTSIRGTYSRGNGRRESAGSIEDQIRHLSGAVRKYKRWGGRTVAYHADSALASLQNLRHGLDNRELTKEQARQLIDTIQRSATEAAQHYTLIKSLFNYTILFALGAITLVAGLVSTLALFGGISGSTVATVFGAEIMLTGVAMMSHYLTNAPSRPAIEATARRLRRRVARLFAESDDHTTTRY